MSNFDRAVSYVEARIAIMGGESSVGHVDGVMHYEAVLPGARTRLQLSKDTARGMLYYQSRPLGGGNIDQPDMFASLMHNTDVMIHEGIQPPAELFDLANALAEHADNGIKAFLKDWNETSSSLPRQGQWFPTGMISYLATNLSACGTPAIEEAARALLKRIDTGHGREWSTESSFIFWNSEVEAVDNDQPYVETANGRWRKVVTIAGIVETARSLGTVEGKLGWRFGRNEKDTSQLYAFYHDDGTGDREKVVAAARFEYGEFVGVVRHKDRQNWPAFSLNEDVALLLRNLPELELETAAPGI